jgi:DNA polymerase-3 subunit gamma/tau
MTPAAEPAAGPDGRVPWEIEAIRDGWPRWAEGLEPDLAIKATRLAPTAILGPNQLAVGVDRAYNWVADACEAPETRARIEAKLGAWLGRLVALRIDRPAAANAPAPRLPLVSSRDEAVRDDPMVRQVVELFDARPVRVEVDEGESA